MVIRCRQEPACRKKRKTLDEKKEETEWPRTGRVKTKIAMKTGRGQAAVLLHTEPETAGKAELQDTAGMRRAGRTEKVNPPDAHPVILHAAGMPLHGVSTVLLRDGAEDSGNARTGITTDSAKRRNGMQSWTITFPNACRAPSILPGYNSGRK